jgi:polar amino acid transport system substrate-binding protein
VKKISGIRLLPGNFMVIQQAMGMPKSRSDEAITALREYVEEMKRKGFVDESLQKHNVQGA